MLGPRMRAKARLLGAGPEATDAVEPVRCLPRGGSRPSESVAPRGAPSPPLDGAMASVAGDRRGWAERLAAQRRPAPKVIAPSPQQEAPPASPAPPEASAPAVTEPQSPEAPPAAHALDVAEASPQEAPPGAHTSAATEAQSPEAPPAAHAPSATTAPAPVPAVAPAFAPATAPVPASAPVQAPAASPTAVQRAGPVELHVASRAAPRAAAADTRPSDPRLASATSLPTASVRAVATAPAAGRSVKPNAFAAALASRLNKNTNAPRRTDDAPPKVMPSNSTAADSPAPAATVKEAGPALVFSGGCTPPSPVSMPPPQRPLPPPPNPSQQQPPPSRAELSASGISAHPSGRARPDDAAFLADLEATASRSALVGAGAPSTKSPTRVKSLSAADAEFLATLCSPPVAATSSPAPPPPAQPQQLPMHTAPGHRGALQQQRDAAFLAELEALSGGQQRGHACGARPDAHSGAHGGGYGGGHGAGQQMSDADRAFLMELEFASAGGGGGFRPPAPPSHNNSCGPRGNGPGRPTAGSRASGLPPPRGIPKSGVNGCPTEGERGNWRCLSCANINFGHRNACNRCKQPRPPRG